MCSSFSLVAVVCGRVELLEVMLKRFSVGMVVTSEEEDTTCAARRRRVVQSTNRLRDARSCACFRPIGCESTQANPPGR